MYSKLQATSFWASQVAGAVAKSPPANAGRTGGAGSIPGWGRSPGEGNGSPFQYSCLENSIDRGAWRAIVPGVVKESHTISF